MSIWVNDIIKDIEINNTDWKINNKSGISNDKLGIIISCIGNSALLSVCDIDIYGKNMWTKMTYMDRFRIERSVNKWSKRTKLKDL